MNNHILPIRLVEIKKIEIEKIPLSAGRLENVGGNIDLSDFFGGQPDVSQNGNTKLFYLHEFILRYRRMYIL